MTHTLKSLRQETLTSYHSSINIMVANLSRGLSTQNPLIACSKSFHAESTIQELPLWNCQFEVSGLGYDLAEKFQLNPLVPAVILTENYDFIGTISRRQFLENMSRPFGRELFENRSVKILYQLLPSSSNIPILSGETSIISAAKIALKRNTETLYEPIVVKIAPQEYRLLNVHELLFAQSLIHEFTTKLLQEKTQAILLQSEKMASLGRMVAGIAHEIRNPINCIGGNLPFLSNYYRDLIYLLSVYEQYGSLSDVIQENRVDLDFLKEDLPELLNSLFASAERLTQLVESLHNFSHIGENLPQLSNIHDCIDSTLLILKNKLKIGIKVVKKYQEIPIIKCYSGQLSQVFMNLLSNAIDALLENRATKPPNWYPCIEISTELQEKESSKTVVVKIADNGVGIPIEIQTKIFETFFTTKPKGKGSGLGLAISYEIITQKHGGQLLVKSQPNIGTEFKIVLPIS